MRPDSELTNIESLRLYKEAQVWEQRTVYYYKYFRSYFRKYLRDHAGRGEEGEYVEKAKMWLYNYLKGRGEDATEFEY